MALIIFMTLLALISLISLLVRANVRRSNIRERLMFAFEQKVEKIQELNLASGDYGLSGSDRFVYFLTKFLSTPIGYLGLFSVGAAAGVLIKILFKLEKMQMPIMAGLSGAIILMLVNMYISNQRKNRIRQIRYELPNALQSIVAVMESGLAFESALQHVVRESGIKHPLYFDLQVMMDAMQQGRRRNEALKLWATRANERTVVEVTTAMIQADQTGASLGGVLRHHATTQLKEIEAELLKKAERIPIYMIMPMMLCILPPIFLVAVGPSVLRIARMFEVIMSKA